MARAQGGIVAREQLIAMGVSWATVTRMIHRGELEPVAPAVFLVRGAPFAYRGRLWAAVLSTCGVLGFATAADLWGVIEYRAEHVHVVVPHRRRLYPPPWVRLHRVPVPASATTVRDGLPATGRTWTVLDHLGTLPPTGPGTSCRRSAVWPPDPLRLREYLIQGLSQRLPTS